MTPVEDEEIRPDVVRRTGGGWLAVAPKGAKFVIAVTAPTQGDAQDKFGKTYSRWLEIYEAKELDVPMKS